MTYQEARAFIEETKKYGSILGLTSIQNLMAELGNVQEELRIIHIAGTNGKGSTGAMLAQILREAGYHVGEYHSPAVFAYEEIIQADGTPITEEEYAGGVKRLAEACGRLTAEGKAHPTSFELETALAFLYFKEKGCDIVVLETGMGGREDATNLITSPLCSVVTTISRDHMAFLGNTIEEIAAAKAGIIKRGRPVVTAEQESSVMHVLTEHAKGLDAPLYPADKKQLRELSDTKDGFAFTFHSGDVVPEQKDIRLSVPLLGEYQKKNVLTVLKTVEVLREQGFRITDTALKEGLKRVRWQGRFEVLCEQPYVVIDGAHNEGAAMELKNTIEKRFTNREIIYIIGVLADKEHEKMLRLLLPYAKKVYTVTPPNPRALSGELLCKEAGQLHPDVTCADSIAQAMHRAVADAGEDGMVLAFGSLSYLGQLKQAYLHEQGSGSRSEETT